MSNRSDDRCGSGRPPAIPAQLLDVLFATIEYNPPSSDGLVANFLTSKFLFWLEALSLMRSLSAGTASILTLRALILVSFQLVHLRN